MSNSIDQLSTYSRQGITASVSTGTSQHLNSNDYYLNDSMSTEEQVETYYLRDVERVESGLCIMMLLFPIYERYLRWKVGLSEGEKFSENNRVFRVIAVEIGGMNQQQAYRFWQCCRNYLLHQASVEETMILCADGAPVKMDDKYCYINPYALRETLLGIFQNRRNRRMWKDWGEKLPRIYCHVKP